MLCHPDGAGDVMRKKILVVDDTRTVRALVRVILGDGYDYVEAKDGREAVERATQERPDVIVMDVVMPECDGVDALALLRGRLATAGVPVIFMTTRSQAERVEPLRSPGLVEVVAKPALREELAAAVGAALGSHASVRTRQD
jgi:CheY-like chemotaxis protein